MFIKTTRSKNREYIKLVESYRDENKVTRHNVLYNFGRTDEIKNSESFINVVKKLCEIANVGIKKGAEEEYECSEAEMLNYGYLAYLKLWEDLGIGNCLRELQDKTKGTYSINDCTFLMAIQHLLSPKSKLATYGTQYKYMGLKVIELHQLYRVLEKLGKSKESIENELFNENYIKIGNKVDVVFYDVTTFAFESIESDELKNFGFSKDCKFKEVQVVMGLIIDSNGLPIGYELFPGNKFEGKTMMAALANIQKRFGINRVVIVADRGLNCKENLNLIKEAGYGYIVSSRIKGIKKEIKKEIFDEKGYVKNSEEFKYKIIEQKNIFKDEEGKRHELDENLIISYSEKRAKKDFRDRERLIEKAKKLLEQPSNIKSSNKRGGKKYLREQNSRSTFELDEKLIEKDSKFDGYYGIVTSEKEMSGTEIIEAYRGLWRIEESFGRVK